MIRDPQEAVKAHRNTDKQSRVEHRHHVAPYAYQIDLWRGPVQDFADPMEFYANIGDEKGLAQKWRWEELDKAGWKKIQTTGGAAFGPTSTLDHLHDELKGQGTFKRAWRLWDDWKSGAHDGSDIDEYTLVCLAETGSNYVFFHFVGYVIH